MRIISKISLIFLTTGFFTGICAQDMPLEKTSFSLSEAIEYALIHNTSVLNSKIDLEIAEKQIWEVTATGLPQVSASASYMNNLKLRTTLIPAEFFGGEPGTFQAVKFGTQHNADAGITANQLLFNGPYIVGLQASRTFRKLAEQNATKSEMDVRQGITEAYFLVLLADSSLITLKGNLENMKKINDETQSLQKAGFLDETDADQMNLNVLNLENAIRSMERQAEIARKLLKFQMGLPFDSPLFLTQGLDEIFLQMDLTEILLKEFKLQDHIDYRLMNTAEQIAFLDMKRIKYEYFPTLSMFYSFTESAQRSEFNLFDFDQKWYESSMLGFSLNIPIFSSGARMARVSQKKLAFEKARNNKTMVSESLQMEYDQASFDFKNALDKYRLEVKNVDLAKRISERTAIKYKEGMASSLDLTNANSQFLNAVSNLTLAQIELMNAKLRLEKALNEL